MVFCSNNNNNSNEKEEETKAYIALKILKNPLIN
jgi:hypothetical protein